MSDSGSGDKALVLARSIASNFVPMVTGDVTAATQNTAALASALAQGGAIRLVGTGEAYTNDTLVITTGTMIDFGAVRLRLAPSTTKTMMVNAAHLTAWTTISGGITASGRIATVQHNAHGYAAGDCISIAGATSAFYNGVFRVETVVDVNNFTVRLPFPALVTTATGTPKIKRADRGIALVNPAFNYDQASQGFVQNPNMMCAIMNNVSRLSVRGFFARDCAKYGLLIGAIADSDLRNSTTENNLSGSDGVHFQGPCHRTTSTGHYGRTGDDAVSLTIGDYVAWEISRGDYVDTALRDINIDYCAKNLTKYAGNAPYRAENLTFDGIAGYAELTACDIVDDTVGGSLLGTSAGKITISRISASCASAVFCSVGGKIDALTVDGVDVDRIRSGAVIQLQKAQASDNGAFGTVKLRNAISRTINTGGVTGVSVSGFGTSGNALNIDTIDVDADFWLATGHAVALQSTADLVTVGLVRVSGRVRGNGDGTQTNYGVYANKGTITRTDLSRLQIDGMSMAMRLDDTVAAGTTAVMSAVQATGCVRLAEFRKASTLVLNAVTVASPTSTTNVPIRFINAGTYRAEGSLTKIGFNANTADITAVVNSGTPTMSLRGNLQAAGDEVNGATIGDEFYNCNASSTFGTGTDKRGRYGYGASWTKIFGAA